MLKKFIVSCAAVMAAAAGLFMTSLTASALTVEDVAAEARRYGYDENTIQYAINEYYGNPEYQTEEALQEAMAAIHSGSYSYLTTVAQVIVETTTAQQTENGQTVTTTSASPVTTTVAVSDGITLTASDGSTFTRVSSADFIAMSYEEKMAYIASFSPAQQQAILDNLSPEEHRSILKQLPTDQKAEVVSNMSEFAKTMGLEMTVDEMTDDELTLSVHNSDGELVGVSSLGVIVEDTGYDRRGIIAASLGIAVLACAGIVVVLRKCFTKELNGGNNEK